MTRRIASNLKHRQFLRNEAPFRPLLGEAHQFEPTLVRHWLRSLYSENDWRTVDWRKPVDRTTVSADLLELTFRPNQGR